VPEERLEKASTILLGNRRGEEGDEDQEVE
jgi:hypothetical protein